MEFEVMYGAQLAPAHAPERDVGGCRVAVERVDAEK